MRLSGPALETLAVVAYRQPVSRARVSAIRGVNSDGVIRTLTLRGLIEEAGRDPEHQAVLYRTTGYFLERLGLNDVDELPDRYVVTAEVPGLCVEDIEVTYRAGSLTVRGEKTTETERRPEKGCLCRERRYGKFERRITLPEPVEEEKLSARCCNGVLEVTLPKSEEARGKAIKIDVED